jgi:L-rhamnose mutarotase
MQLKPGFETEYKKRHDEIWPELSNLLSESGISEYSIFLDEDTLTLFAFQKLNTDFNEDDIPNHPIVKKWWTYMADIMVPNPDNSTVSQPLKEVF